MLTQSQLPSYSQELLRLRTLQNQARSPAGAWGRHSATRGSYPPTLREEDGPPFSSTVFLLTLEPPEDVQVLVWHFKGARDTEAN